ncbi:MAG: S8 family serine peptidase [Brachymonas sp.]|nr:S8 family serine peptidase [Brachymonas sp.]
MLRISNKQLGRGLFSLWASACLIVTPGATYAQTTPTWAATAAQPASSPRPTASASNAAASTLTTPSLPAIPTPSFPTIPITPPSPTPTLTLPPTVVPTQRPPPHPQIDLQATLRSLQQTLNERYSSPNTSEHPQHEPGQLIVSWPITLSGPPIAQIQASGGTILSVHSLRNLGISMAVVQYSSPGQAEAALPALQNLAPEILADRLARAYPMQASPDRGHDRSQQQARHYALAMLNWKSLTKTQLSQPISIGIIDTAIAAPQALAALSYKSVNLLPYGMRPASTEHGTGIAAAIAAQPSEQFHGAARNAHLRVASIMREITPKLSASHTALIAQALDWLMSEKVQIINLSLGSAHDKVLEQVIRLTLDQGIVLVAAAGNAGPQSPPVYPAAYPGVIAVTAVDTAKQLYSKANRGAYIAIAAPGVDVWLPVAQGKYMSGTSFATPFVAAAVAHLLASQPQQAWNDSSIRQALCQTAQQLPRESQREASGCGLLQP